ncbi:MAG TPA: NUDIX domain-containing protein [Thermoleophilaceae bacterium]|nr:NUDIX domain-containing protein [Thermoleophilaceae bacterium]
MRVDRPHPGEELNQGEVTEARQAASIIVLRDSPEGPEVLLVQRNPKQRFMGGAWVFPGGAVHAEDADHSAAAIRELKEEAGVDLPHDGEVVPWSRWITPEEVKVRFDTWFFVAAAPPGAEATVDGSECVDSRWLRPAAALDAFARDELMLVFPTIKHLEALAQAESVADALHNARTREVVPVQPKVMIRGEEAVILLPGEQGYDEV